MTESDSKPAKAAPKQIVQATILTTRQDFMLGALVPGPLDTGDRHVIRLELLNGGRGLAVHYSETDGVELYCNVPMCIVLRDLAEVKIAEADLKKNPLASPQLRGEPDDGRKSSHA